MKKIFLTALLVLFAAPTLAEDFTAPKADIWEPGKTLPTYRVRQMPNGNVRIHYYGNPFEYKYRIDRAGDPFQRVGNVRNGLPDQKRGGK